MVSIDIQYLDPTSIDTIAAVATARGEGGVAVVRISGANAQRVLDKVFERTNGTRWAHARMYRGAVLHGAETVDEGLAVLFKAPRSYTGELVAEIHGHGGYAAPERVLAACIEAGARLALPGEFTFRAFINGKLDLMQAEAVAELIEARTPIAAAISARTLLGTLSERFMAMQAALLDLLARIEACIDFPEEDIEEVTARHVLDTLEHLLMGLESDIASAAHLRALREGVRVCLMGSPNAGKSSLFNALLGEGRAIISEHAGTTRDTIEERVRMLGTDIVMTDTAGLRDSKHPVERMGVERTYAALDAADIAMCVIDASKPLSDEDIEALNITSDRRRIVVLNKTDLKHGPADASLWQYGVSDAERVSAVTGAGLDALRARITTLCAEVRGKASPSFLRQRQVDAARNALSALKSARDAIAREMPLDCAAVDLKEAYRALGAITGRGADEDVVRAVFATFCLGK